MNQKHPGRSAPGQMKTEPKSREVSLDKVSGIGLHRVRTHPETKELYKGRGYEAPMAAASSHKRGSQGKY